ncbi:MAG: hypothetical protein ACKVG0_13520, partial [Alphaproteobacteria bacterium]
MQDAFPHGPYAAIRQRQLNNELASLLRGADIRFAICDMMREALGKRYGVPFVNLQSPVNTAEWFLPRSNADLTKSQREIIYCGTVMKNAQLHSLVDIAKVVERLNLAGLPVRLTIATPPGSADEFKAQFSGDNVRFIPYRGKEDMLDIFSRANLLLIPVNFDNASRRFIRYSMPGKHVV